MVGNTFLLCIDHGGQLHCFEHNKEAIACIEQREGDYFLALNMAVNNFVLNIVRGQLNLALNMAGKGGFWLGVASRGPCS